MTKTQQQQNSSTPTKGTVGTLGAAPRQLLHAKVQCLKVREALAEKRIAIYDAFAMFNDSRSGMLSLGEVNGALLWLGLLPPGGPPPTMPQLPTPDIPQSTWFLSSHEEEGSCK